MQKIIEMGLSVIMCKKFSFLLYLWVHEGVLRGITEGCIFFLMIGDNVVENPQKNTDFFSHINPFSGVRFML